MTHRKNGDFWHDYQVLPAAVRERANKRFALLKANSRHPFLHLKKIGERDGHEIWSARVSLKYRALAVKLPDEYVWYRIGEHGVYDTLV